MSTHHLAPLAAGHLLLGIPVQADSTRTLDDFYSDFAVPDLAALTLLGAASDDVSRPVTPRELAAEFLNGAGSGTQVQPGMAVEWAPFLTFLDKPAPTLDEYREHKWLRGFSVSMGTLRDSSAARMAWGFKWVLVDRGDPLLNDPLRIRLEALLGKDSGRAAAKNAFLASKRDVLRKALGAEAYKRWILEPDADYQFPAIDTLPETCLDGDFVRQHLLRILVERGAALGDSDSVAVAGLAAQYNYLCNAENLKSGRMERELEEAIEAYQDSTWNSTAIQVGGGMVWRADDFKWSGLEGEKGSLFLSCALRAGSWGQFILQPQATLRTDSSAHHGLYSLGGRFLSGKGGFRWSIEGVTAYDEGKPKDEDYTYKATSGVELKINKTTWMEVAVGSEGPVGHLSRSNLISAANLKFGFGKEPRFKMP